MIKQNIFLFFLMLAFLGVACKHEPAAKPGPGNNNTDTTGNTGNKPCNPDTVYFEKDIQPILLSNCTMSGCHGNGSAQDGVDLTSYESVMRTADVRPGDVNGSDLYEVITEDDEEKRMPQPPNKPLSQEQISLIAKWIQQGAQNKKCSSCDSGAVTFSLAVMPVLTKNCVGCHNDNLASGSVKLNTHANVKIVAENGRLLGAISHSGGFKPMPQGGNKLPDCTINRIKTWVQAGAPNN